MLAKKTAKRMMIFHSTYFQPSENAFGRIYANTKIQIRSRRYLDADYFVPKLITVLGWFGLVDRPTQLICIFDICKQTNTKEIAGQSVTAY